ncbi:MAG: hypothetical protein LLG05_13085 [Porphyromonadaceae bacterium]|nr:hypothetical protein [Porphyromonadaceae bacterium]
MKTLYEQQWFINSVNWLRKHSDFFEKYGYGKSQNVEDFIRNPFEVLRDNCFPFVVKNVKPFSILLRCGFKPYQETRQEEYYAEIKEAFPNVNPDNYWWTYHKYEFKKGKRLFIGNDKFHHIDLIVSEWVTKYPNAAFMFQLLVNLKYYIIPIPFVAIGVRYSKTRYFQLGMGWGTQWQRPGVDDTKCAVLCGKFRFAGYEKELEWNPNSEVFGYWEGNV